MIEELSKMSDNDLMNRMETLDKRIQAATFGRASEHIIYQLMAAKNAIIDELSFRREVKSFKNREAKNLTRDKLANSEDTNE